MKSLFAYLFILSLSAAADMPSTEQNDWCGGQSLVAPDWGFGNCFLEQENTGWVSRDRLTLGYPAANDLIFDSLEDGACMISGDFNCSGFPDLAIADNSAGGTLSLLISPGSGLSSANFWEKITIASGLDYIRSLAAADMDADGDMDIAAVYSYTAIRTLAWFENPGFQGRWLVHNLGEYAGLENIDCGDFDQDGDIDIVCACFGCDTVRVLVNTGTEWTEETVTTEGNGPIQVKFTDINSDGSADVLAVFAFDHEVSWFEREPSGPSWQEHHIIFLDNPRSVFPGDYDDNGTVDVLASGLSVGSAYLCENLTGSGESWNTQQVMQYSTDMKNCCLSDMDNDGDLDAVFSQTTDDLSTILTNDGQSPDSWFRTDMSTDSPKGFAVLDSNGDGFPEVACLSESEARLLSSRPGVFQTDGSLTSSVALMPAGTFDVQWGNILWNCWTPSGTEVAFQIRASETPGSMGEWSQTITESGTYIGGFMPEDACYIQYRVFLSSDSPDTSPYLYSVEIEGWNPGGTEESFSLPVVSELISISNNPSSGNPVLSVYNGGLSPAVLRVFDVSGREIFRENLPVASENHLIEMPELPAGTYTAIFRSNSREEYRRFCVIR